MGEDNHKSKDKQQSEKITYSKRIVLSKNHAALDVSRKELYLHEKLSQQKWAKKYSHLRGDVFKKILIEEYEKAGLLESVKNRFEEKSITTPHVSITPVASPTVPKVSSRMVGWRSSPEYNLEFVGKMYISPKYTIEPPKTNVFQPIQQKFIFLG